MNQEQEIQIQNFVKLSKYAGTRFDLTQAGGGNTSVKLKNGNMLIKASGYLLSEVELQSGFSIVNTIQTAHIVTSDQITNCINKKTKEKIAAELLQNCIIDKTLPRPSIETFFHAILSDYVLHTHPVLVNAITCQKNWKEIALTIVPSAALVGYETPGIELTQAIEQSKKKYFQENKKNPQIYFLKNHGLIIDGNNVDEVIELYETTISKIENYFHLQPAPHRLCNWVADNINLYNDTLHIAHLSEDQTINELLKTRKDLFFTSPFCPDRYVFNGIKALEVSQIDFKNEIEQYITLYNEPPKVILYLNKVFFIAKNLKKAKEMEDVFKFHLLTLSIMDLKNVEYLSIEELAYLGNWDAEKYRQKL